MKKYLLNKYNTLLFLTIIISSCALDDDSPTLASGESITIVSLNKTGQILTSGTSGENVDIELSEALQTDTKVEYTLNGMPNIAIIEAGTSRLSLDFPTGTGVVNTVALTSATGLYNNVNLGENTSVTFFGASPTVPGKTVFALAWDDAAFDQDLYLVTGDQDLGGTVVDSSLGFTNLEVLEMDDTEPNMTYSLFVDQWGFSAPVFSNIIVSKSDGTYEIISGTVPAAGFVAIFVKEGTTLTFTSLL